MTPPTRHPPDRPVSPPADPVQRNVAAIAEVEQTARRDRTPTQRAVDAVSQATGRPVFLLVQLGWIAGWLVWNLAFRHHAFDPPPFKILNTVVSLEAITLSTFVLISQNRMAAADNRREQLNLQVGLLAEAEMTNALNLLHRISRHLGLPDPARDAEARGLAARTDILEMAKRVEQQLTPEATLLGDAKSAKDPLSLRPDPDEPVRTLKG